MKKLVMSICMLLVAASLLGTSTFAWFSMNKTVSATGMQITAKTSSTFLLIGSGTNDTASEIQALVGSASGDNGLTTDINVPNAEASVLPAAHETIATATAAAAYANWYTGAGTAPDNGALVNATKTVLTDSTFASYVIKRTVYLTVAVGGTTTGDIKVALDSMTQIDGTGASLTHDPVSIVVACGDTVLEFNKANSWTNTNALTTAVASTAVKTVDIYIYYDGNNSAVTTNNFANLSGASFNLKFTAEDPTV